MRANRSGCWRASHKSSASCIRSQLSALLPSNFSRRIAMSGDSERVVGFDNERGKVDHCPIRGVERSYNFSSVEQSIEDFITAVDAVRGA